ncbi:hypothetical protein [Bifidobacterium sp. UTCIF-36]|uniref:hypothetical protein n=1 Tax=Bifidobacterium sp. UTCIF-36 TaxID=1465258 RepID=UPI001C629093|nr:hypothetical protein [Bifidobacterium sp. UTCIF-36]TPF79609.1 hypothetical protein BW08_08945 [Bifidobacterium sp. UTCIF-24]TPF83379.1 hypothetical protein BW07_10510 [Bifidobacterium sp. UTCIF-36]TPF88335.1 hypothetical protein BW10_09950 [Bifidobacterium sp. UTBIF-56]
MTTESGKKSKECWYQYLTDVVAAKTGCHSQPVDSTAPDRSGDVIPLGEPYNLWDAERGVVVRHVNASWLDTHAQTKDTMDAFVERMKYQHVEELVIHNDRPKCGNPHYRRFSSRSIEAFRTAVMMNGITCRID